jgi:hypothetical protein
MFGAELVVGYLFAWLAGKGKRAARRADGQVDRAVDAAVDRLGEKLHQLVAGKLGDEPSLERLGEEAQQGAAEPSERTKTRVTLALEDAVERDPAFGAELDELVRRLREADPGVSAAAGGVAIGGNVDMRADHGSVAANVVQGDVNFGNPPTPGTDSA